MLQLPDLPEIPPCPQVQPNPEWLHPLIVAKNRFWHGNLKYSVLLRPLRTPNAPQRRAYSLFHPRVIVYANESGKIFYNKYGTATLDIDITQDQLAAYLYACRFALQFDSRFPFGSLNIDSFISPTWPMPFARAIDILEAAHLFGDQIMMCLALEHIETYISPVPLSLLDPDRPDPLDMIRPPALASTAVDAVRLACVVDLAGLEWYWPVVLELFFRLTDVIDLSQIVISPPGFADYSLPLSFLAQLSHGPVAAFREHMILERRHLHAETASMYPKFPCAKPKSCAPRWSTFEAHLDYDAQLFGGLEPLSKEVIAMAGACDACRDSMLKTEALWATSYYHQLPTHFDYQPDWHALAASRTEFGLTSHTGFELTPIKGWTFRRKWYRFMGGWCSAIQWIIIVIIFMYLFL